MLRTRFGFALRGGGLRGNGFVHFEVGHLELAEKVEQKSVFFRREVSFGFFVESIEHINKLARSVRVNHRFAGARIGIGAEDHGGVASEHANQALETGRRLGSFSGGRGRSSCGLERFCGFVGAFLALHLFNGFLAELTFCRKWAAVNYAKSFIGFVVGQGDNPLKLF